MQKNNLNIKDIDKFIFHQGSKYIVDTLIKRTGVDAGKVIFDIADYGNTVSSSIPIILEKILHNTNNKYILISGFGVGLSWSSNILINNKTQLEFLEDCEIGIVDPSHLVTNNKSRLLANLLNNYNIGSWNNNPNSIRTTANFIVDYIGDPELAPLEYRFNINCSYIVVLSLLDNKKYEQYVLMVER